MNTSAVPSQPPQLSTLPAEAGAQERPSASITPLNRYPSAPRAAARLKPNRLISLLALLLVSIGVVFYFRSHPVNSGGSTATDKPVVLPPLELASVDVEVLQMRNLARTLPISGSIGPLVQVTIKAKGSGEVREITVLEGQDVAAGDVIARIDARNLRAQYDRELAAVEKARAELRIAKLNRDKNKMLLEQRYISQNTFEASEGNYVGTVANLKLAEAQLRVAEIELWDAVIRAPVSGTVAKRNVQPGEKVAPDSQLITLVDLREMLLEAAIPAADIPNVEVGQAARFTVSGFGRRQFEGTVQRINPITTENSRAVAVYIAVGNSDRALKGGMFAQGQLQLGTGEPVLAVPRNAVRTESGVSVVYTLDDDKIARQEVTTGMVSEDTGYIEITSGLQAGRRIILTDIGDRKPGDPAVIRGESAKLQH